jgi:hypothetical protein
MTKPLIQIGDEVREMTDAEHDQWQTDAKAQAQYAVQVAAKADAHASALAKLSALGLTEAEIAAIIKG